MTVIAGIKYNDGIVMASDLLMKRGGKRAEYRKLAWCYCAVAGYAGVLDSDGFDEMRSRLAKAYRGGPQGLEARIPKISNAALNKAKSVSAYDFVFPFAIPDSLLREYAGKYTLRGIAAWRMPDRLMLAYDGAEGYLDNIRFSCIITPAKTTRDTVEPLLSEEDAIEAAGNVIYESNARHHDECSGLEVVALRWERGAESVLYEPPEL